MSVRFQLGEAVVQAVVDLPLFEIPLGAILPDAVTDAFAADLPWLEPLHVDVNSGMMKLACQAMRLQTDGVNILVDTCVGCGKPRPNRPDWHLRTDHRFIDDLYAAGVVPEQIDFVFCSHLHADHVGWNTRLQDGRWVPTFPNARYLVGRTELAHWQSFSAASSAINHGSWTDSVLPIVEAGQCTQVDDGFEIAAGITLRSLVGHTPGQMGLFFDRGQDRAVFCGDAIHSPLQILHPAWSTAFCTDRAAAAQTRSKLLGELASNGGLLIPAHFRGSGRARIKSNGGGFCPDLG